MDGPHILLKLQELVSGIFVEPVVDFFVVGPPSDLKGDPRDEEAEGWSRVESDEGVSGSELKDAAKDNSDEICPTGRKKNAHHLSSEDIWKFVGGRNPFVERFSPFECGFGCGKIFFQPAGVVAN